MVLNFSCFCRYFYAHCAAGLLRNLLQQNGVGRTLAPGELGVQLTCLTCLFLFLTLSHRLPLGRPFSFSFADSYTLFNSLLFFILILISVILLLCCTPISLLLSVSPLAYPFLLTSLPPIVPLLPPYLISSLGPCSQALHLSSFLFLFHHSFTFSFIILPSSSSSPLHPLSK